MKRRVVQNDLNFLILVHHHKKWGLFIFNKINTLKTMSGEQNYNDFREAGISVLTVIHVFFSFW